jgi:hypothetical protein
MLLLVFMEFRNSLNVILNIFQFAPHTLWMQTMKTTEKSNIPHWAKAEIIQKKFHLQPRYSVHFI